MKNLRTAFYLAIFVVASIGAFSTDSVEAQSVGQQDNQLKESVDIQVAKFHLELTKLDLRRVLDTNRKSPKFYSDSLVERLRGNVGTAEIQLKLALKEGDTKLHDVHIRRARTAIAIAESNEKNLRALSRSLPSQSTVADHKRSKLALKLAKLRLEQALDPKSTESPLVHLQWQMEQLSEQVLELSVIAEMRNN